ncbi:MAG: formate dehydrogenase, partial [Marmoricola sp.]|nr:formate dehydrogenase [Marmoricola sp.]
MSAPEPASPPETGLRIDRFGRATRWVHWLTSIFMTTCILTAAVLYNGSLSVLVGHRFVV